MTQNTDERWNRHNEMLDSIDADSDLNFLKNIYFCKFIVMPLETNTKVCEKEIELLKNKLNIKEPINVLEMGAGFGNFCRILHANLPIKSYTILDTSSMIKFSKTFLNKHQIACNFISSETYQELFVEKFDLFISNLCISETPEDYREDIVENIWNNTKMAYVIDGCTKEYNKWLKNKFHKFFSQVEITPLSQKICLNKHQYLHIGIK